MAFSIIFISVYTVLFYASGFWIYYTLLMDRQQKWLHISYRKFLFDLHRYSKEITALEKLHVYHLRNPAVRVRQKRAEFIKKYPAYMFRHKATRVYTILAAVAFLALYSLLALIVIDQFGVFLTTEWQTVLVGILVLPSFSSALYDTKSI